jgi:hypothetical protein
MMISHLPLVEEDTTKIFMKTQMLVTHECCEITKLRETPKVFSTKDFYES